MLNHKLFRSLQAQTYECTCLCCRVLCASSWQMQYFQLTSKQCSCFFKFWGGNHRLNEITGANSCEICKTMFQMIVFNPNHYLFQTLTKFPFCLNLTRPQPQYFHIIKTARQEYFMRISQIQGYLPAARLSNQYNAEVHRLLWPLFHVSVICI